MAIFRALAMVNGKTIEVFKQGADVDLGQELAAFLRQVAEIEVEVATVKTKRPQRKAAKGTKK